MREETRKAPHLALSAALVVLAAAATFAENIDPGTYRAAPAGWLDAAQHDLEQREYELSWQASPVVDGVEVRISGRIDRVDVAELDNGELGFWIIDYKTGRSSHYTATDTAELRKLQLPLYALAVEGVFLHGQGARPLGLAYWLVSDSGPKVVLPGRNATHWLDETRRWPAIRERLVEWVTTLAASIRKGRFPLAPRSEHCSTSLPLRTLSPISKASSLK